jgi:hypothetical protein
MTDITHQDGVAWHDAPIPPADHHCWPQTMGWVGEWGLTQILRCPCGAIARGSDIKICREMGMAPEEQDKRWDRRNSRAA